MASTSPRKILRSVLDQIHRRDVWTMLLKRVITREENPTFGVICDFNRGVVVGATWADLSISETADLEISHKTGKLKS